MTVEQREIVIIGAGPSGSVAAALLRRQGHDVLVLEREVFPRFSIGESLLPQCVQFIEEAGLLRHVVEAGFQFKDGATFGRGDAETHFDFRQKFSPGWGTAWQVQRGRFDKILADGAAEQGAEVRYQHTITAVDVSDGTAPRVTVSGPDGTYVVQARLLLDASGFARVLPRFLQLEEPSTLATRQAIFTHVEDRVPDHAWDRNKIRITVHPTEPDVWYWTIPFSDGRTSQGVVAEPHRLERVGDDDLSRLRAMIAEEPSLTRLMKDTVWDTPARRLVGYSAAVKSLHGPGWVLLGNAGEFLDPIFSSGVTIAMHSASLAAKAAHRQLTGESVDWNADYAVPLKRGVDTFRVYVDSWYAGEFQQAIFYEPHVPSIRRMISSILAGYAWDTNNPFVAQGKRRMKTLIELIA